MRDYLTRDIQKEKESRLREKDDSTRKFFQQLKCIPATNMPIKCHRYATVKLVNELYQYICHI